MAETFTNYIEVTPVNADNINLLEASSSDEQVVTVTQDSEDKTKFTITAVAEGTATITATLGELTDECDITVTDT